MKDLVYCATFCLFVAVAIAAVCLGSAVVKSNKGFESWIYETAAARMTPAESFMPAPSPANGMTNMVEPEATTQGEW